MPKPPTVLLYGDDPAGATGFGRIVAQLVEAVRAAGALPRVVALKGRPSEAYDGAPRIHPSADTDPRGWQAVQDALGEQACPLLISVGDPWDIQGLVQARQQHRFHWIGVTPVDSTPYPRFVLLTRDPPQYLDVAYVLGHMDQVVTYAPFGAEAVAELFAELLPELLPASTAPESRPSIETIGLGVDRSVFRPMERGEARRVFQGGVGDDALLVSCVKVNSPRAGFDTLLAAWARYLALAGEVDEPLARRSRLYLHTVAQGEGHSLPLLMQRHGVGASVLLNPGLAADSPVSDLDLAQVHAASDLGISAARAEGFGLPILEALACGVPCIVPDYGAPAGFGGDAVARIPIAATYNPEFAVTDFAIADVEAMASTLLALARDDERRRQMGQAGIAVAREMSWAVFVKRWTSTIETALTTP